MCTHWNIQLKLGQSNSSPVQIKWRLWNPLRLIYYGSIASGIICTFPRRRLLPCSLIYFLLSATHCSLAATTKAMCTSCSMVTIFWCVVWLAWPGWLAGWLAWCRDFPSCSNRHEMELLTFRLDALVLFEASLRRTRASVVEHRQDKLLPSKVVKKESPSCPQEQLRNLYIHIYRHEMMKHFSFWLLQLVRNLTPCQCFD